MIKSMTGYGIVNHDDDLLTLNIETKTLNSKFLDIALKLPKALSIYEMDIKKLITKHMIRGKVSFSIEMTIKPNAQQQGLINQELFEKYYTELKSLNTDKDISDDNIYNNVLKLPEIISKPNDDVLALDKSLLLDLCEKSLLKCSEFRIQEGNALSNELISSSESIASSLDKIMEIDPDRISSIKARIADNMAEFINPEKIDENRFEQEIIYYIEKLDINEETSRLKNHLSYFKEVLDESESQGKKLGFISQEIGREINTIGSKANNSDMQRLVVDMKDELEKIKEQVLNAV